MTKIKCKKCNVEIEIPEHDKICEICFGEYLGKINDIEDSEERYYKLSDFINELVNYEHQRTIHNEHCSNMIEFDGCFCEEQWSVIK